MTPTNPKGDGRPVLDRVARDVAAIETEHTPTRWRVNPHEYKRLDGARATYPKIYILGESSGQRNMPTCVALVDCSAGRAAWHSPGVAEADANAAFIVRACNSHAALLAVANSAADEIAEFRQRCAAEEHTDTDEAWTLFDSIEGCLADAIAKATQ